MAATELGSLAHFYLGKVAPLSKAVQDIWCNMTTRWVPDEGGSGVCQGVDIASWEQLKALSRMRASLVLANVAAKRPSMAAPEPLLEPGLPSHVM